MKFKNVLQKAGIVAFSGVMVLSCLTPAVHAEGDGDKAGASSSSSSSSSSSYIPPLPTPPVHGTIWQPLDLRYRGPATWTAAEEAAYYRNYFYGPLLWIHNMYPHRELRVQDPHFGHYGPCDPIPSCPRDVGVYKLWDKHGRRVPTADPGKDLIPSTSGLELSPSVKAKLDIFINKGLSSMPEQIRYSMVKDFENVFKSVPESDREKVIDSFTSIALDTKSLVYEVTARDDYWQLAYDEFVLLRHSEIPSLQLDFMVQTENSLRMVHDTYMKGYATLLNNHAEEIIHRYKTCGLPIGTVLDRLSIQKAADAFDAVYAIRPSATKAKISTEACEKIIIDNTEDLDPLIRDEIRKDFHEFIIRPYTYLKDKEEEVRLKDTFAFCQMIFEIKEGLYRTVEKASRGLRPDPIYFS